MARIGPQLRIRSAALAAATPALAEDPAVARPTLRLAGPVQRGIVFFVAADLPAGAAAIGTAHTFDLRDFARSQQVEFRLGNHTLATSSRLLASPGRAFDAPGASLRDDFLIFALEAPPEGVRLLEPASEPPAPDTSVRVLGLDRKRGKPRTLRGRISRAGPEQIEVVIDGSPDLEGWGGAPVIDDDGRVVGMLQARWRSGATSLLAVAPLAHVLAALDRPLEGGEGQTFARALEGRDEPSPPRPPGVVPTRDITPSLLEEVRLSIEYPSSGTAVASSTCGVFVAGRALAQELTIARFDVAIVIDTSESTQEASGADVDGDGTVGAARLGTVASLFSDGISDSDDSILAAEVAAARQLLFGLDPRSTRVTVITFAGGVPGAIPRWLGGQGRPAAIVRVPLSSDYEAVDRALQEIQSRAPAGATDMAAGLERATRELLGDDGAQSEPDLEAEKIVFFFTDGVPTLPHRGFEADNVREVLRAADRSRLGQVRVHAFAIGPEALEGP
ncbi:MAG: VWA domain-containing protein, partial [Myxococcota bacterium]